MQEIILIIQPSTQARFPMLSVSEWSNIRISVSLKLEFRKFPESSFQKYTNNDILHLYSTLNKFVYNILLTNILSASVT